MRKQIIRLTENDLHQIIMESARRIIKEEVDMGQVPSAQDKRDKRERKESQEVEEIRKKIRRLRNMDGDHSQEIDKLKRKADFCESRIIKESANAFYDEEDSEGKCGEPGMVKSYDIGWNNSVENWEHEAEEEGLSLEDYLKEWWKQTDYEPREFRWQKLGNGYGYHGDTILRLDNVVFKDIYGQLLIDEYAPDDTSESFRERLQSGEYWSK